MKVQNVSKSWKLGWTVKCAGGHVAVFFSTELMSDPWNLEVKRSIFRHLVRHSSTKVHSSEHDVDVTFLNVCVVFY